VISRPLGRILPRGNYIIVTEGFPSEPFEARPVGIRPGRLTPACVHGWTIDRRCIVGRHTSLYVSARESLSSRMQVLHHLHEELDNMRIHHAVEDLLACAACPNEPQLPESAEVMGDG